MFPPVFYRSTLNGAGKEAYRRITDGLLHLQTRIRVPYSGNGSTALKEIIRAVHMDHPELFYVNWWEYQTETSRISPHITVCFTFLIDVKMIKACWTTLLTSIDNLQHDLSQKRSLESQYALISNHIVSSVHYMDTGSAFWDHTAAGPILSADHTCVCEGVAKLFLLYCQRLLLPCILVTGMLHGVGHAWNAIEYRGRLRYIDLTALLSRPLHWGTSFHPQTAEQLQRAGYEWDHLKFRSVETHHVVLPSVSPAFVGSVRVHSSP